MFHTLVRNISDSFNFNTLVDFVSMESVTSGDTFIYLLGASSIAALMGGIHVCRHSLKRRVSDAIGSRKQETVDIIPVPHFFSMMAHAPNFTEKCKELVAINPDVINVACSAEMNNYTPFLYVCYWSGAGSDLIELMLEKGADVSITTADGETPLYLAVYRASKEKNNWDPYTLQLLIEAGCDVNAANRDGNTPLHVAAKEGHVPLTRFLIIWGADPEISNRAGIKPYEVALRTKRSREREDYICVARLLQGCIVETDECVEFSAMTTSQESFELNGQPPVQLPRFSWNGKNLCEMYYSQI